LWHALPPFRFPRVPERLLPIACLCIGALVAALVAATRSAAVAAVVVALLFTDLHVRVYGKSVPGEPDAVAAVGGRLLELPVFDPGIHYGSVYLLYDTAARVERPGGYSTTAPLAAKSTARRLERLNCGDWSDGRARVLRRLGVRTIALHLGLYVRNSATPNRSYFAWRGLIEHGWSLVRRRGPVWVYARRRGPPRPSLGAPPTRRPVFCQGWYGNVGHGWPMSETHAPFWIYGKGTLQLRIANPHSHFSAASLRVDGRDVRRVFTGGRGLGVALGPRPRWHLVTFDVQHLVRVGKRNVGLTLLAAATSPEPR
jgi:hypothetical protein